LLAFVQSRLGEIQPPEKPFNWNVCVVVGNSHVKKSLEVITELELNGEQLEFDYDMFGKLRQQLASAIIAMEKHTPAL
uniref:COMM domain-containing protein n=1 Tax=Angiostrongylus costaricensis TaxID=334426 RepID=A0A0R3PG60_ANGCS